MGSSSGSVDLITTFDPGEITGWCQCRNGLVIDCGMIRVYHDRPLSGLPVAQSGHVLIEKPVYRYSGPSDRKASPDNLISLAMKIGRLIEIYLALGCKVQLVKPTDWKGSVPKQIQNDRDFPVLTPLEKVLVGMRLNVIPDGQRNNVLDAIGIALWYIGRST